MASSLVSRPHLTQRPVRAATLASPTHRARLAAGAGALGGRGVRCQAQAAGDLDSHYMRRCAELALKAAGHTSPNPMVGCVIVRDGRVVGEGFHPKAGQPHAEIFALRDAGNLAENATAYVSLEPCNHYGRTPPCTEALINAKVKEVVVGMTDPNPIVASKGIEKLQGAGINVRVGVEEALCRKLNEAYIHRMLTGKAFATLRATLSMNGIVTNQIGKGADQSGGVSFIGHESTLTSHHLCPALLTSHHSLTAMVSESEVCTWEPHPLHPDGTEPLQDIAVDYCPEACLEERHAGKIHVTYDDRGGARWRSKRRFLPGSAVATTIRAPAGDTSGLNYNIYLSSLEGSKDQDEIDFEFLGHDKRAVQTNYYVNGVGGREHIHELPFDSSDGFHHYAIAWDAAAIEWRVDGELVRREERREGEPWPEKPMYLYASVSDASYIADGAWTGTYHGRDAPYVCSYKDVRVPTAEHSVEEPQDADAVDAPADDPAADADAAADATAAAAEEEKDDGAGQV